MEENLFLLFLWHRAFFIFFFVSFAAGAFFEFFFCYLIFAAYANFLYFFGMVFLRKRIL